MKDGKQYNLGFGILSLYIDELNIIFHLFIVFFITLNLSKFTYLFKDSYITVYQVVMGRIFPALLGCHVVIYQDI